MGADVSGIVSRGDGSHYEFEKVTNSVRAVLLLTVSVNVDDSMTSQKSPANVVRERNHQFDAV